jgi:hypothetical protein
VSPTARSLAYLRAQGALAQVVERWVPQARRRVDLFGFIDIAAITMPDVEDPDSLVFRRLVDGVLGIQTTTTGNLAHRLKKLRDECAPAMRRWLKASNRLEIHGWSKKGARGKRKTWQLTVRTITLADLDSKEKV